MLFPFNMMEKKTKINSLRPNYTPPPTPSCKPHRGSNSAISRVILWSILYNPGTDVLSRRINLTDSQSFKLLPPLLRKIEACLITVAVARLIKMSADLPD